MISSTTSMSITREWEEMFQSMNEIGEAEPKTVSLIPILLRSEED